MDSKRLLGHGLLLEHLKKQADSGTLSHALLFSGPEGIGKKMTALLLAEHIFRASSPAAADLCRKGALPDFLLIEAETIIKVDQIRQAVQFAQERPLYAKSKVLLIDDAHKMNPAAQNKLLKTLEEPPHFLTILLVSANVSGLLETVRSRVLTYTFETLSEALVLEGLPDTASSEQKKLAARFSGGSLRRALQILEDEELQILFRKPEEIFEALYLSDQMSLVRISREYQKDRVRAQLLLEHCLMWLRDLSLFRKSAHPSGLYYPDRREQLARQSRRLGSESARSAARLSRAKQELEANAPVGPVLLAAFMSMSEGIS